MPSSVNYRGSISSLLYHYRKRFWFKWFYPRNLARALENYQRSPNVDDAMLVYKYLTRPFWFFQRWLFPYLVGFDERYFVKAYKYLEMAGLVREDTVQGRENFTLIEDNYNMVNLLANLSSSSLLNQENFTGLMKYKDFLMFKSDVENNPGNRIPPHLLTSKTITEIIRLCEEIGAKEAFGIYIKHYFSNPHHLFPNFEAFINYLRATKENTKMLREAVSDLGPQLDEILFGLIDHGLTSFDNPNEILANLAVDYQDIPPAQIIEQVKRQLYKICYVPPVTDSTHNINPRQSKHTSSVNLTTQLTAWLLFMSYGSSKGKESRSLQQILKLVKTFTLDSDITAEKLAGAIACLGRLDETSIDIYLTIEDKVKCLSFIKNSENLSTNIGINALLVKLESNKEEDTTIPLTLFIRWLWKEISINQSDNFQPAFVKALYEIERSYNIHATDKGSGKQAQPTCDGGIPNKFCECLQGLSPLIQFIDVNHETVSGRLQQFTNEALIKRCNQLLKGAKEGNAAARTSFCELLANLMDANKAGNVFMETFVEEEVLTEAEAEFSIYTLLYGAEQLHQQIKAFKEQRALYLPPLNTNDADKYYSNAFLEEFRKLLIEKATLEGQEVSMKTLQQGASRNALHQVGKFAAPVSEMPQMTEVVPSSSLN